MADIPKQNNNVTVSGWVNPTSLVALVLLAVVVIVFFATYDWPNFSNDNNVKFTSASVNAAPVDDPRLIREHTFTAGNTNSSIVIVEFSDFECPFCRESFPVVRSLLNRYGNSVQFAYRHFPVESIHPNARLAAEASQCAAEQSKFLEYHDRLFLNQNDLGRENLVNYATQAGLNVNNFTQCLDSGKYATAVDQDLSDGVALGVRGTPTWFINGRRVEGAIPQDLFFEVVEALIAEATGGR